MYGSASRWPCPSASTTSQEVRRWTGPERGFEVKYTATFREHTLPRRQAPSALPWTWMRCLSPVAPDQTSWHPCLVHRSGFCGTPWSSLVTSLLGCLLCAADGGQVGGCAEDRRPLPSSSSSGSSCAADGGTVGGCAIGCGWHSEAMPLALCGPACGGSPLGSTGVWRAPGTHPDRVHRQPRAVNEYWARLRRLHLDVPGIMQLKSQQPFVEFFEVPQLQFIDRVWLFQLLHRQGSLCRRPEIRLMQFWKVVDTPVVAQRQGFGQTVQKPCWCCRCSSSTWGRAAVNCSHSSSGFQRESLRWLFVFFKGHFSDSVHLDVESPVFSGLFGLPSMTMSSSS